MNVSMHLHDCEQNAKKCATASMIADWERRNGQVKTIPPQRRAPDTQRINACEGKWRLDIHGLK